MGTVRAAVVACLVAASAFAAPKLVVERVPGERALSMQLEQALCQTVRCAPRASVLSGGALDWRKVEQQDVRVLTGRVTGQKAAPSVSLSIEDRRGHAEKRWSFPLSNGRLSEQALSGLQADLSGLVEATPAAANPLATAPIPFPRPARPPPVAGATPAAPASAAEPELKVPLVAGAVGFTGLNMDLSYDRLTTGNLRPYHASFVFAPRFELEGYPLAPFFHGWVRGVGIELAYQWAVGLSSSLAGGGPSFPTHYHQFDLAAKLRWRPFAKNALIIEPLAGLRLSGFNIEQTDGQVIAGVPDLAYNGLRVGIGAEYPVWRLNLYGRASFLPLLSAGKIESANFFPSGSLYGWEIEAGAGYPFLKHFEARASFEFTRYHYNFNTAPGDVFQASGAVSRYVGARVMLRYSFD